MPSPWTQRMVRDLTIRRGRCQYYIGSADVGIETVRLCKRTGKWAVRIEGRQFPEGPWCWQHARIVEDRAVAEVMNNRRVTIEEVPS